MLISAAVAITAINDLDDRFSLKDAGDYRGAAGWALFVAISAIIFNATMIVARIMYLSPNITKLFSIYAIVVGDVINHNDIRTMGFSKTSQIKE